MPGIDSRVIDIELCYHLVMRLFGKRIRKKTIKKGILFFATILLLLSGLVPFLSTLF